METHVVEDGAVRGVRDVLHDHPCLLRAWHRDLGLGRALDGEDLDRPEGRGGRLWTLPLERHLPSPWCGRVAQLRAGVPCRLFLVMVIGGVHAKHIVSF